MLKLANLLIIGDPKLNTYNESLMLDLQPPTLYNETGLIIYYVLRKELSEQNDVYMKGIDIKQDDYKRYVDVYYM